MAFSLRFMSTTGDDYSISSSKRAASFDDVKPSSDCTNLQIIAIAYAGANFLLFWLLVYLLAHPNPGRCPHPPIPPDTTGGFLFVQLWCVSPGQPNIREAEGPRLGSVQDRAHPSAHDAL